MHVKSASFSTDNGQTSGFSFSSHLHTPVRPMLLEYGPLSFRLFCKNLGHLREFFGQMVYRPSWQKISRTPMEIPLLLPPKFPVFFPKWKAPYVPLVPQSVKTQGHANCGVLTLLICSITQGQPTRIWFKTT